jgi:membrane associated rhomboid family serine protease
MLYSHHLWRLRTAAGNQAHPMRDHPSMRQRRRFRDDDQEGPSLLTLLVVVNIGVYVLQNFLALPVPDAPPTGAISLRGLQAGEWWTVFTHLFVHYDWVHLLLNMLLLVCFGRKVQAEAGQRHFAYLYFLGGWAGTALQLALGYRVSEETALVGASGAAFSIMAAFAVLDPNYSVTERLRRFIPWRLKARNFVLALVLAELALEISQRILGSLPQGSPWRLDSSWIAAAHLCHVGGAALGCLYALRLSAHHAPSRVQPWHRPPKFNLESFYDDPSPMAGAAQAPRQKFKLMGDLEELPAFDDPPTATEQKSDQECMMERVDLILEKLHAAGYESLTSDEKRILGEAARRLGEK